MNIKDYFKIDLNRDVREQLDFLATLTLNNSKIVIENEIFYPTEIELLCFIKDYHEDPWLHNSYSQLNHLTWYFHGKTSNRYGLDLTFGNIDQNIYASMLLRGIKRSDGKLKIYGPSKISNYILDKLSLSSIDEFKKRDRNGATKEVNPHFYLDYKNNLCPTKIFNLPRSREIKQRSQDWNNPETLKFLFQPYKYSSDIFSDEKSLYFNYMWLKYFDTDKEVLKTFDISTNIHNKHLDYFSIGQSRSINQILSVESSTERQFQLLGYYHKTK